MSEAARKHKSIIRYDPNFRINAQSSDGEYEKTHMFTDGRFHFDPDAGAPDNFLFYYVIEDPPLKCKVTVAKRDAKTHKFLEGAAFTVTIVKDGKTTTQKMTEAGEGVYRLAHERRDGDKGMNLHIE